MRCITSAIVLLLSALLVLARVPLHRRAVLPQPSEPEDISSSGSMMRSFAPFPALAAYSGLSFVALYFIAVLRRKCKIPVAGRRLLFRRAATRMGALELEGSEVELLPTVAEPGVLETRLPLPAVLDDSHTEDGYDITESLVKPADSNSIPLIPISTMTPLPPPSPFTPPSSPPPLPYAHPSPMRPSRPYDINDHVPVSPYASPPSQHIGLPKVPLSPPLLPTSPIRQSRLGSPRPSRSTPSFSINARFATSPQRSKSSPPLPRTRTKLGHEISESASDQQDENLPYSLFRAISPSPLPKSSSHAPKPLTLSPPPHAALSRSKSTGSDLIDLTTPEITPNASIVSLVRVAHVDHDVFLSDNEKSLLSQDLSPVKAVGPNPTPTPLTVDLPKEKAGEGEGDRRSEVDLVDLRFRPSPTAPGAIALSLSNSSSVQSTKSPAARPADIVVPEKSPVVTAMITAESSGSLDTSSSSFSSPESPSIDLFAPQSIHSTPDTTPMRDEFMLAGRGDEGLESDIKQKEDHDHEFLEEWNPDISFDSDLVDHDVEWHDHSGVWESTSPAPPLPSVFDQEVFADRDLEMGEVELIDFEDGTDVQMDLVGRLPDAQATKEDNEPEVDSGQDEDEAIEVKTDTQGDVEVINDDGGLVAEPQTTVENVPPVEDTPVIVSQAVDEKQVLQSDAAPFAHPNVYDDSYDINDESRQQYLATPDDLKLELLEAGQQEPEGFQDEVTIEAAVPFSTTPNPNVSVDDGATSQFENEVEDQEHPDPDLLPLPLDIPPPASPAGLFYIKLAQASALAPADALEWTAEHEQPSLLPALVISAPTPSKPAAKDFKLRISCAEAKPASPLPSPSTSRMPTPLQTPTPPSSPPVSPLRRPRAELPSLGKVEKADPPRETKEELLIDQEKEDKRPAWSIRAADAPALGLPSVNINAVSPRAKKAALSLEPADPIQEKVDVGEPETPTTAAADPPISSESSTNATEPVVESPKSGEATSSSPEVTFPEPIKLSRSLPGSFDSDASSLRLRSAVKETDPDSSEVDSRLSPGSSSSAPTTSTSGTQVDRTQNKPRTRSAIDIALAMQLRPGIGIGADPAWLVRFLMAMFGWFAVLISGSGEMDALLVGRR